MEKDRYIMELLSAFEKDIKAEVLIAGLLENEFIDENWVASFDGIFKRGFTNDLQFIENIRYSEKEITNFHLSRDGIYDSLPEGLFHPIKDQPSDSAKQMAIESKKERKREEDARLFFKPYEQELFYLKLIVEKKEREFLTKLVQGKLNDIFIEFWKIDANMDVQLAAKLVAYLPFRESFIGHFNLTFNLLELLIEDKVNYTINRKGRVVEPEMKIGLDRNGGELGNSSLGWDLVCGSAITDLTPEVEITIGPIVKNSIEDFFVGGRLQLLLDCFISFFIPFEFESRLVIISPKTSEFILAESPEGAIFGYETYI